MNLSALNCTNYCGFKPSLQLKKNMIHKFSTVQTSKQTRMTALIPGQPG